MSATENAERYKTYLDNLRKPFTKLCRLRFLNPDNSTAFAIDNNRNNKKSRAFVASGSLDVNFQNGQRRSATVTLANADSEFDYDVNNIWFGQQIALDEGMILPDGTDYYIQQGVFLISTPKEELQPVEKTITFNLVDKWANLDGTLSGNLEATYEVAAGTNIFAPISALLKEDIGNGTVRDNKLPIYTLYYNDKTQELSDGSTASLVEAPYTLTVDGTGGTEADVILGLVEMVNGVVGYDSTGCLRVDASQDDIDDQTKPIDWTFSQDETTLLGMSNSIQNTEVFNDYIVVGEQMDDYTQPCGRAQNLDPRSPTNIKKIGVKTTRVSASGYSTYTQCEDLAVWKLKRATVLQKSVSVSCSQILHLKENDLIEIVRTDKEGSPTERHLIQGFSRPLTGTDNMTITCTSVQDFPIATLDYTGNPNHNYLAAPWVYGTTTQNGITFTVDDSAGTIVTAGNATANNLFALVLMKDPGYLPAGTYKLTGAPARLDRGSRIDYNYWGLRIFPKDGRSITAQVKGFNSTTYTEANLVTEDQTAVWVWDKGYGATFTIDTPMSFYASIYISQYVIADTAYTGADTWTPKLLRTGD